VFGAALVFGVVNLLVNVVDHYDKRNNETQYKMLSRVLTSITVILVIWATSLAYGDAQPQAVVV
jgi:O-antigen/teichoic acid export membrane protein